MTPEPDFLRVLKLAFAYGRYVTGLFVLVIVWVVGAKVGFLVIKGF